MVDIPAEIPFNSLEAGGLAVALYVVLWCVFWLYFRRIAKPPRVSLHLFALSLAAWSAGRFLFPQAVWVGHAGAAAVFSAALFLWVLIDRFICVGWLINRRQVPVPTILRQLGAVVVVLMAVAAIMKWGYQLELTGLLATSGIAAIILGFAMQDLLSNVIAGFSIHMTRAYRVGDWLLLGEKGDRAEVTEINWRSTRFVNNDQVSFELPNSDIVKNRIVNLNYPTAEHAIRLQVGLDYDVPPALAKGAIIAAAAHAQGVMESPTPVVFLREFGESAVIYELRVWMRHARLYNAACDDIRTALWYELNRREIRIPFPIRSIDVRTPNVPETLSTARGRAAELVGSGSALGCLTPEEIAGLVGKGKLALFGPREALVTRGEEGSSMFVVLEGAVEVFGKSAEGPRLVLARLGPGECFGEQSLFTGEPRNATVRAESDTLVLEIRKADLSPLIEANPELAERLGDLLERRKKAWEEALNREAGSKADGEVVGPAPRSGLAHRIRAFFGQG